MYLSFMRSTPGYEIHRGLKPSNIPLLAGSAYLNVEGIIKNKNGVAFVLTCLHMSGFVFEFGKEMLHVRPICRNSLPIYHQGINCHSTVVPGCFSWSDPCLCMAGLSRQFHGEIKQVVSVVQ
jgi:hypothetical protein